MIDNRITTSHGRFFPILSLFFLNIACLFGQTANASDELVSIGIYENAPKVFLSESGEPSGIFIDIIEHIAKSEGWKLNYVSGTWAEGLDRLERGEIDLMPDVAYTADRESVFSFHSVPVLSSWYQVYAPKSSGIISILDLDRKRISVLERSVQHEDFARLANSFGLETTLIPEPDYKSVFEEVTKGGADAAITNHFYGAMHAKNLGLEDTAVLFSPSDLFFAASRNDPKQLLTTIDRHLLELKRDPQSIYYISLKRWTSEEVHYQVPVWLRILGLVVGIVLLMSLLGSVVLKYQVNARTLELIQINQEMEQRIIERTSELALAKEHAESADRLKSAFLAAMSHELRTPLNSIIGFTGIVLQGLSGPLNPEQTKQLGMVQGSARHLLELINDVLDLSKIEADQLEVEARPFNARESVEKVVRLVKPLAEKKNLDLSVDLSPEVGELNSDRRRFEQVLINLINNGLKFTEKGSVRVVCAVEGQELVTKVVDTGIGIKPEDMGKLFKPFQQIDVGLARSHEGTGLGLSICKRLVEKMGGRIWVESQWGVGSVFKFSLPLGPSES